LATERRTKTAVTGRGRWGKEAATTMNGRIIEAAAPEAYITARRPGLTALMDLRSTTNVRTGALAASKLTTGNLSLLTPDLPK